MKGYLPVPIKANAVLLQLSAGLKLRRKQSHTSRIRNQPGKLLGCDCLKEGFEVGSYKAYFTPEHMFPMNQLPVIPHEKAGKRHAQLKILNSRGAIWHVRARCYVNSVRWLAVVPPTHPTPLTSCLQASLKSSNLEVKTMTPATESNTRTHSQDSKKSLYRKNKQNITSLDEEIDQYLNAECEEEANQPLAFWKANLEWFPSLSNMARSRTYLASSAPCEHAFSVGQHIYPYTQNKMSIKTLES
ncbi:hypothetical protein VP01_1317g4 [Puccinia sorghi]|uniref:HAT C-terminal dimerisation domain-containing protein n=1 Tax=Puccinia sorghi TaxID=27349 RepID=A0A0L6VMT0_9BASI|nr:hypothetical protein VP01_1317g4 [Puccinia sorghi]